MVVIENLVSQITCSELCKLKLQNLFVGKFYMFLLCLSTKLSNVLGITFFSFPIFKAIFLETKITAHTRSSLHSSMEHQTMLYNHSKNDSTRNLIRKIHGLNIFKHYLREKTSQRIHSLFFFSPKNLLSSY